MAKLRPIVGTVANLSLLTEIAERNVVSAQEQAQYFFKAIQAARKKLNETISRQKNIKATIRRRAKLGNMPKGAFKDLLNMKAEAAYKESQIRAEIESFKSNLNVCREVEFSYASMLKLIDLQSDK